MNEIGKDRQVERTILGQSIIQHEAGMVEIRAVLKTICNRMGFPEIDTIKILTAASEITRIFHESTSRGTVIYAIVEEKGKIGLKLTFNKPGGDIPALDEPPHERHGSRVTTRAKLSGAKKLMDDLFINPREDQSIMITAIKWLNSDVVLPKALIEQLMLDIVQTSDESTVETLKTQNREILELLNELRQKYQQVEESNTQLTIVNEKLEIVNTKLAEQTKALKEAQEMLIRQEKLAAIGKLAGSVSHEIRNPLGIITNAIYFLILKIPATDEKIAKHLRIIQEESARATKIISDLLDFARLKPEESFMVDVQGLLKETLEQIQKPEHVTIQTRFDNKIPFIHINPRKMQQVFHNIIVNAFQAMDRGGELEISWLYRNDLLKIAFKDTGIGIPAENLLRLFEPLFSTKIKGIGLGLVIAKDIIESYKGKIEVKSVVGAGSTFTITLPIPKKKVG